MKVSGKSLQTLIIIIIIIIAISAAVYFYLQYQEVQKLIKNPTLAAQEEIKNLTQKVGLLMELPKGEDPTVATVSDKNKLKDQPFFAKAQDEDKVLIFTQAKKAILYRLSINKIIEVASVNIGSNASDSSTASKEIRVALYNGTNVVGLTSIIEKDLKSKMDNINVVEKENAASDYTKTLVIDLSGSNADKAKQIASLLNGEVGRLPKEETKPDSADILVILGK